MIDTVTGKIPLQELGRTLIHEHMICTGAEFRSSFSSWLPEETVICIAAAKLKYVAEKFGVRTVIDGTPLVLGRDLELLKKISLRSGVQIAASTGFYFYDSFSLLHLPVETLARFILEEIKSGSIKPAMFKCAADRYGITPAVEKALKVAAAVHKESGIPVYCHSHPATRSGIAAQQILEENGVTPGKTVIGHVSDGNDPSYALELLKKGCYVSIDRIHPHNAAFAAELVNAGFSKRIFLSHDHICCYDSIMNDPPVSQKEPHGLDVVHRKIIPEMLQMGVTPETAEEIMTGNIIELYKGKTP